MALFSGLRKGTAAAETAADPAEAIARAILAPSIMTIISDGSVDSAELAQLGNLCAFSPIFQPLGDARIVALIEAVTADMQARGANAVMAEAVPRLTPALRETAMIFAMRMAMADRPLADVEKQLLMTLSRHMQIPDQVTDTIFSVVVMLQRPATA